LCRADIRHFNIPAAAIGGLWAYIPQRDEKGNHYIAKVMAHPTTAEAIRVFHIDGTMPEGGFRFVPAARSNRQRTRNADAKRRYRAPKATSAKGVPAKQVKQSAAKLSKRTKKSGSLKQSRKRYVQPSSRTIDFRQKVAHSIRKPAQQPTPNAHEPRAEARA
jgi:hypothetical protein